jgi:hypothetical protein
MGGRGQFSHAFSGEVYEFYSFSPEYFGYTLVPSAVCVAPPEDEQVMLETCRGPYFLINNKKCITLVSLC